MSMRGRMPKEALLFMGKVKAYLKLQWGIMLIAIFSVGSAYWVELCIRPEYIDSIILIIGFTLGVIFLYVTNIPWLAFVTGCFSLLFNSYASLPYVRQVVVTAVIAACCRLLWDRLEKR